MTIKEQVDQFNTLARALTNIKKDNFPPGTVVKVNGVSTSPPRGHDNSNIEWDGCFAVIHEGKPNDNRYISGPGILIAERSIVEYSRGTWFDSVSIGQLEKVDDQSQWPEWVKLAVVKLKEGLAKAAAAPAK